MDYCDFQAIKNKILRVLPTLSIKGAAFAVQEQTKRKHVIQNWVSIGLKFESSGYKPLWDVHIKDPENLKEQLRKACADIGIPYSS